MKKLSILAMFCLIAVGCDPKIKSKSPENPRNNNKKINQILKNYKGEWTKIAKCMPKSYVIQRADKPINIDGSGSDPQWEKAQWTSYFVDIEGDAKPNPKFKTRVKMLWDDKYIYFYAEMEEPHIWATEKMKNNTIYWDNDFEIFIDPDGDSHNYYEFEMNAFNTIWELYLTKAYRVGGDPRWNKNLKNGKVDMTWGEINSKGLKSAVKINGTINNPNDKDAGWSVEVAIPFEGLKRYAAKKTCPPKAGDQWRLNFSRVNWDLKIENGKYGKRPEKFGLEYNWVWSPIGVVSMHTPENWGYIQFADKPDAKFVKPADFEARRKLSEVFYRQREYKKQFGRYATCTEELGLENSDIQIRITKDGFVALCPVKEKDGKTTHRCIRQDALIF